MKHIKSFAYISPQNFYQRIKTEKNIDIDFTKKIIKSLLYIYYFEKDRDEIFNNQANEYYLINFDWMRKFKDIAPFKEAAKKLPQLKLNIKYNNLNNNAAEKIIRYFLDNNSLIVKDKENFKELTNVIYFIPKEIENNKIISSPSFYLISSETKDVLEEIFFDGKNLQIDRINLTIKDKKILVKEKNVIKVYNIDETNKITIQYIFMYNTKYIFDSEFSKLEKLTIEKYIYSKGCKIDNYGIQILKRDKFSEEVIGKLNILKNGNVEDEKEEIEKEENSFSEQYRTINAENINNYQKYQLNTYNNYSTKNIMNRRFQIKKPTNNLKLRINNNNFNTINNVEVHNQTYQKNILEKEEPKIEKNIKKVEAPMGKDNLKIFEKKYDKIFNNIEEQFKKIYKKFDDVITYNKKLESKIDNIKNEKINLILENQNQIKLLAAEIKNTQSKLNEYKDINDKYLKEIEELKEENKKLKEAKEEKKQNNKIININQVKQKKNIQLNNYDLVNTNQVLNIFEPNKKNIKLNKQKKEVILIGLKNRGQAPFINCVIQCLVQTDMLSDYFKNNNFNNQFIINPNLKLSISYKELVEKFTNKNIKSFYPEKFISDIREIELSKNENKLVANENIYEFLNFILNQLHDELKSEENNINNFEFRNQLESNSYEENIGNQTSIITDIFQIINESRIQCASKNINNIQYKFEKIFYIKFDIKNKGEEISIKDCLINMREKQISSKYEHCDICDKDCYINHLSKIFLCPKILIIMLKYENNDYIKINYEEVLDITNFTKFENEQNVKSQKYNLYGVISLIYDNKYVASCKNFGDNKWYRFDDENIEKNIGNLNNDVINYGIPLILFYYQFEDLV